MERSSQKHYKYEFNKLILKNLTKKQNHRNKDEPSEAF